MYDPQGDNFWLFGPWNADSLHQASNKGDKYVNLRLLRLLI